MQCPYCDEMIDDAEIADQLGYFEMGDLLQTWLDRHYPLTIFPMTIEGVPMSKRDPGVQNIIGLRKAIKGMVRDESLHGEDNQ